MFGLNDSSNKTNLDPTQPVSGDLASLPPLTATVPADNSAGGSSALGSINENTTSAPSASSTTALDNSATATASAGIGDVSLENAYIATDPPQITKRSDDLTNKPSAASLVDQGFARFSSPGGPLRTKQRRKVQNNDDAHPSIGQFRPDSRRL
jgi:hypothetical protein